MFEGGKRMKKYILLLLFGLLLALTGCKGNTSLSDVSYFVSFDNFNEDELMLVDEGIYSKSFVLTNQDEVNSWLEEQRDNLRYEFIEDINNYDESYFEENSLVVAYITRRAYTVDFFIKNQELKNNTLSIEIQYYIPWYAFGDSWPYVFSIILEIPKVDTNDIAVEITYVER